MLMQSTMLRRMTQTRTTSSIGEIADSIQTQRRTSFSVWRGEHCMVCHRLCFMGYLPLTFVTSLASTDETPSEDSDSLSIQYESGNDTTENDVTVEPYQHPQLLTPARADFPTMQSQSHAAHVAASRGLNIAVTKRANRHSRVMGLPVSPRPPTDAIPSPIASPLQTAKQS
jgi:hypothetical protein